MINTIIKKELMEYSRDGRVLGISILIVLLVLVGLLTGWSTHTSQQNEASYAQNADQEVFLNQGEKNPHSAAHFGRMAYKSASPFAMFDPGSLPYLGQVIWLEAHAQDPAMFRPAEDSPDLRRLADLSVAGVLTLLLPLLIFLIGYGSFAAERERGTLRQIVSIGSGISLPFVGKMTAIAGVGIISALSAIVVSIVLAFSVSDTMSLGDILLRGMGLIVGYSIYCIIFSAIALWVSSQVRTATSALLILLSLWAVSNVIVPRIAANLAENIYPTPSSEAFWTETSNEMSANRPARESEEYREAEKLVLSRALDREVKSEEIASLNISNRGLSLEVSEVLAAIAYTKAYQNLYQIYNKQLRVRRVMSLLSPAIALQHFSSAIAGTDIAAHRHFAMAAEQQRNVIVRKMNEDLIVNDVAQTSPYLANSDFWENVPDFEYRLPTISHAFNSAFWDLLLLLAWAFFAFFAARYAALRQRII